MDPQEKNKYQFIYNRKPSFSFRFVGLFVVLAMFATIPVIIIINSQQTKGSTHAAGFDISPSDSPSLSGTPSATPILSLSPTTTATITPTCTMVAPTCTAGQDCPHYILCGQPTATPTPSNNANTATASISFLLPAIGGPTGNMHPMHSTRLVTATLYNTTTKQTYTVQDAVTFDGNALFSNPQFSLGAIPAGTYQILVTIPGYLQKLLTQADNTNTFPIQPGTTLVIPTTSLVVGDIAPIPGLNNQPYGDNVLDISDYNVLIGCYSDSQPAKSCSAVGKVAADLNDDGVVNAIDYNMLLRSFATRNGDTSPGQPTPTPTPTCIQEPACLLSNPPTCLINQPIQGWCPIATTPTNVITVTNTETPTMMQTPTSTPTDIPKQTVPLEEYVSAPQHGSAGSFTWAQTVGTNNNRLLIVGFSTDNPNATVTVTYGGKTMTRLATKNCASQCRSDLYYLTNPASGTANVVVTISGGGNIVTGSASFYNVDQTSPFGTIASNSNNSISGSVSVTTTVNQLVIDAFATTANHGGWAPAVGQYLLWHDNTVQGGGSSMKNGSNGTTTMTWNSDSSSADSWAEIAVPIN